MKIINVLLLVFVLTFVFQEENKAYSQNTDKDVAIHLKDGIIHIKPLTNNAVRVRFFKSDTVAGLPELVYCGNLPDVKYSVRDKKGFVTVSLPDMYLIVNKSTGKIDYYNKNGICFLSEKDRSLTPSSVQQRATFIAEQSFLSPSDERLFGLGQFQDGFLNVRGLTRRLTQVNTQIAIPFILSDRGYALLWNNYGLTDFNPAINFVALKKEESSGPEQTVNVTSVNGTRQEKRKSNLFGATLNITQKGKYALLLDVGQKMASRHNLSIDGNNVIEMNNFWLPPTASAIVELDSGSHILESQLTDGDNPVLYYKLIDDETVFSSPVADCVDYTVFAGTADETVAAYRKVTGSAPIMPLWALGYIHCRERFHSQDEILKNAVEFRNRKLPVDVIVQDWQYWGKYGWNAMRFDEDFYPDPKQLVDSLHRLNCRFMVSVWAEIDPECTIGKQMKDRGYYIPNTSWIDFFNPDAAAFYWKNFSKQLLKPYGIDAWWQDATEPENDDLSQRMVAGNKLPGEVYRNAYPLFVNKTVYEGCRADNPAKRTMILTRCAFPGIQRYGIAAWSGDVGNDWETLRRQIIAGLGYSASGLPWWTYDAGGFFRPGQSQFTDKHYHERFIRWLQISAFLPLMRVHGYMTDTEFWNYGDSVVNIAQKTLNLRYRLLPYIYSAAADVSFKGSTIMRPLVMDFADDKTATYQKLEYMFGKSFLVAPVAEENPGSLSVYLPDTKGGWYDFFTNEHLTEKSTVSVKLSLENIPVFVRAGSIIPLGPEQQYADEINRDTLEIRIYPGADCSFNLYEDEFDNYEYEKGRFSNIVFSWNDKKQTLVISSRTGDFNGMILKRYFNIIVEGRKSQSAEYNGKELKLKF